MQRTEDTTILTENKTDPPWKPGALGSRARCERPRIRRNYKVGRMSLCDPSGRNVPVSPPRGRGRFSAYSHIETERADRGCCVHGRMPRLLGSAGVPTVRHEADAIALSTRQHSAVSAGVPRVVSCVQRSRSCASAPPPPLKRERERESTQGLSNAASLHSACPWFLGSALSAVSLVGVTL